MTQTNQIDVDALLEKFDTDKSGSLDRGELLPILQQLMQQTEFTNGLLEQVSQLEEQNFAMTRQVKQSQNYLTQAIEVGEQLREENERLRQSVEAQETARRNYTKEIARLRLANETAEHQVKNANQEKSKAIKEAVNAKREGEELRSKLDDVEHLVQMRDEAITKQEAHWHRQLEAARTAINEAKSESQALQKGELAQLRVEIRDIKLKNEELSRALEAAQRENTNFIQRQQSLELNLVNARTERDVARKDTDQARRELQNAKDSLAQRFESVLVENASNSKEAEREKRSIQAEFERTAAELMACTQRHATEKQALEQRLTEAHSERAAAVQELGELAKTHALQVKERAAEELEFRRDAEASYVRLQEVHAQQLELLAEARRDAQIAASTTLEANNAADQVRKELNLAQAQLKQYAEQAKIAQQEVQTAHFTDDIRYSRLRKECCQMLRTFETRVYAMREACTVLQSELIEQQRTADSQSVENGNTLNLKTWHEQSLMAMTALVRAIREAKTLSRHEAERAEHTQREIAEANSRIESLTENEARLESRLKQLTTQRDDSIRAYSERLSAAKAETEAAEARRRQCEQRAKQLQFEIDTLRTAATESDTEIRNLRAELAEARASQSKNDLENQIQTLTEANEKASSERQTLEQELYALRQALATAQVQSEQEINKARTAQDNAQHAFKAQVSALQGNVSSLSTQLDKTKKLLSVLQQQRAQLQQDNAQLQAQLHNRHHTALANVASSSEERLTTPRRPISLSALLSSSNNNSATTSR
uniref:EF-hand domain-containing protein n=1 Tax=Aureoumbra lagunensis TaxID=44058 RepID=A0A7S3K127_9STRA